MTRQETRDRIADAEQEYFDRRLEELKHSSLRRSDIFAKINKELDDIRARRKQD